MTRRTTRKDQTSPKGEGVAGCKWSTKGKSQGSEDVQEMKDTTDPTAKPTPKTSDLVRLTIHNFIVLIFGVFDTCGNVREYLA